MDREIIVVDSMTMHETQLMIHERYPKVIFLPFQENIGYSRCVNAGLNRAEGQYILIINSDVIITPQAIDHMLAMIKQHPDIGLLGPRLLNFNDTPQRSYFRFYTPSTILARRTFLGKLPYFKKVESHFLMDDTDPSQIQTPDWIMGSVMLTHRKAIEKVGYMDAKNFFMYFEDVDWCRRFWHNGYKVVYYPQVVMYHYLGRASKSKFGIFDIIFNKQTRWHITSAITFFIKYRTLDRLKS